MLNILFSLGYALPMPCFWINLSFDMHVVTKIFPKFLKRFQNPPATQEIKLYQTINQVT